MFEAARLDLDLREVVIPLASLGVDSPPIEVGTGYAFPRVPLGICSSHSGLSPPIPRPCSLFCGTLLRALWRSMVRSGYGAERTDATLQASGNYDKGRRSP